MEKQPQQQNTIQDSFLNSARKERSSVTIYLMSGVKLTGRIKSFDKYSVILEAGSQEQLIFKHAISTVAMGKTLHSHGERPAVLAATAAGAPSASGEAVAMPRPSGTEG
jgi:host factor-I protein